MEQYNPNEQAGLDAFENRTEQEKAAKSGLLERFSRKTGSDAEQRQNVQQMDQASFVNYPQTQFRGSGVPQAAGTGMYQGQNVTPSNPVNSTSPTKSVSPEPRQGSLLNPQGAYTGNQSGAGNIRRGMQPQTAADANRNRQASMMQNAYQGQKPSGTQNSYERGQQFNGMNSRLNTGMNAYPGERQNPGRNPNYGGQLNTPGRESFARNRQQGYPAQNGDPYTRDRSRGTVQGDPPVRDRRGQIPSEEDQSRRTGDGNRLRERRLPSDISMPEADTSAAARKRQSEVIYGDALREEVPVITGTPALYLTGKDGHNKPVRIPFTNDLLSRHVMLLGGIGTGKTNAFFQMIDQLQYSLTDDDIMIIFDTKGDFYQEFFRPGDVVISNDLTSVGPNGKRNYWNIFNEINHNYEYESVLEISKSLFAEECKRTTQIFFPNAARDIFMACMLHFLRTVPPKERTNKNLSAYINSRTSADLRKMIESYPDLRAMSSYISKDDSAQTQGVLSELQQVIRNIFVGNFAKTGNLGLSRLVRAKGGKKIFIEYDLSLGEMLTPVYSLMFDMAIKQALGRSRSEGNVYFITDEFRLLPNLVHIDDAVNFGRSLGIKFMIGIQNVEQIFENYGEYRARSILSGFLSSFNFRVNDARSREYIKDQFGRNRKLEAYVPIVQNRGMVEEQREASVVEDWDMTNLGIGQAIIGLPGYEPFVLQFDRYEEHSRN